MKQSWYSTAEVAGRVGLSKRETLQLIKGGEIKAIWIGGSAGYRNSESALKTLLQRPPDRRCGLRRLDCEPASGRVSTGATDAAV